MLYKFMLVLAGAWVIYDRVTYFAVESYASGMTPLTESIVYVLLGVAMILVGMLMPKQVVRDVFA